MPVLRGDAAATRRATRSRTALIDKTSAANAVPAAEPSSTKPAGRDQDKPDEFVESSALTKELTERATRAEAALAAAEHARAESDATAEMLHQALAESEESCEVAQGALAEALAEVVHAREEARLLERGAHRTQQLRRPTLDATSRSPLRNRSNDIAAHDTGCTRSALPPGVGR